jgi:hypothetical protein
MQKPLVIVVAGQMLVLALAVGFLAVRSGGAPKPKHVNAPAPKVEEAPEPASGNEWTEFPDKPPPMLAGPVAPVAPATPAAPTFETVIAELQQGNSRFVDGVTRQRDAISRREAVSDAEQASAVVVTCTDSRVVPELIFDQPMGTFSVVRLPGAQPGDVGARAVQESVTRLHASAVIVLGHLGCPHVARKNAADDDEAATAASVSFATRELKRRAKLEVNVLRVVYAPKTGQLRWLDVEPEPAPVARAGRR